MVQQGHLDKFEIYCPVNSGEGCSLISEATIMRILDQPKFESSRKMYKQINLILSEQ
jgi:hypothetical protein